MQDESAVTSPDTAMASPPEPPQASSQRVRQYSLCLSGGGFRATLFHLGVLRALYDAGYLSPDGPQLRRLSTVSGGSILGAHVALNWSRYCSADVGEFEAATAEVVALARQDVRGRIMRRIPLVAIAHVLLTVPIVAVRAVLTPIPRAKRRFDSVVAIPTPVSLLRHYYHRFLRRSTGFGHGATAGKLCALPTGSNGPPDGPELHILATNLSKASTCAFSPRGFASCPEKRAMARGAADITIAQAVAASSAFPAFFPPVMLRKSVVGWLNEDYLGTHQFALDGGVYDNIGLSWECMLAESAPTDLIIASDASGVLEVNQKRWLCLALPATLRAIDISMNRLKDLSRQGSPGLRASVVLARITDQCEGLLRETQEALPFLRTDLDRFTRLEIHRLIEHGYRVCESACRQNGLVTAPLPGPSKWGPHWPFRSATKYRDTISEETSTIRDGSARSLRFFVLDRIWLAYLVLALLMVAFTIGPVGLRTVQGRLAENRARAIAHEYLARTHTALAPLAAPLRPTPFDSDPDYSTIDFLSDVRVFDLRGWTPDHDVVVLTRDLHLRTHRKLHSIRFQFRTSGDCITIDVPDRRFDVYDATQFHIDGAPQKTSSPLEPAPPDLAAPTARYDCVVRFDPPVESGATFALTLKATYHGAFGRPEQRWAGALLMNERSANVDLLILMPRAHPFVEIARIVENRLSSPPIQQRADTLGMLLQDAEKRWALWHIASPQHQQLYMLAWSLASAPAATATAPSGPSGLERRSDGPSAHAPPPPSATVEIGTSR